MAASLYSDQRNTEGLMMMISNPRLDVTFHPQQPPSATVPLGLFDSSSSSLDTNHRLPILDHLAFDGHSLLDNDPFDIDLFSYLFPFPRGPTAAYDQLDNYTTPFNLVSSGDPLGGGLIFEPAATANTTVGTTAYLEPELAFSSPLGNMEAMQLRRSGTASAAVGFCSGSCKKTTASGFGGCTGVGCPSAHSMAARQRRKRISEKTFELRQLIPGGGRMHTAMMLKAAFKYVRFLQAQIGMLDVVGSSQEEQLEGRSSKEASWFQLLQVLLASPAVHEKLAAEERCVVPTWVVRALAEDDGINGHPPISRDLNVLMASMG